jgi:F-type H+-transporting ATPase subunit a
MDVHVEIAAETLFNIGPIPVTNSMLTMFLVMGFLLLVGWLIAKNAKEVPGHYQGVFEVIVEFLLGLVEPTAGKKLGRQIFPLVGALFIFILFANYSGLLPGVGTIGIEREEEAAHVTDTTEHSDEPTGESVTPAAESGEQSFQVRVFDIAATGAAASQDGALAQEEPEEEHETVLGPFFRAPNADLNMTLAMALITFTTVQVLGIRAHGVGGRIKHMANPPFLFPIELVSELSRIISLSARLFGNVFAGEVLLGVMYAMASAIKIAIIPLVFPVVFLFLEVLFGAVQALVFALLTLIYIALAAEETHEEHEEHVTEHGTALSTVSHAPAD